MATWLDGYLNGLKSAQTELKSDVISLVIGKQDEIKNLIKKRWLLGKKPDGELIGFYRDIDYAIFKQNINSSAGGDVDLTLTGALGDKIKLFPSSQGLEIYSEDWKFEHISSKYGVDNFNITEEEENELLSEVAEIVIIQIFKRIWG